MTSVRDNVNLTPDTSGGWGKGSYGEDYEAYLEEQCIDELFHVLESLGASRRYAHRAIRHVDPRSPDAIEQIVAWMEDNPPALEELDNLHIQAEEPTETLEGSFDDVADTADDSDDSVILTTDEPGAEPTDNANFTDAIEAVEFRGMVKKLVDLGFSRDASTVELLANGRNLAKAIQTLLWRQTERAKAALCAMGGDIAEFSLMSNIESHTNVDDEHTTDSETSADELSSRDTSPQPAVRRVKRSTPVTVQPRAKATHRLVKKTASTPQASSIRPRRRKPAVSDETKASSMRMSKSAFQAAKAKRQKAKPDSAAKASSLRLSRSQVNKAMKARAPISRRSPNTQTRRKSITGRTRRSSRHLRPTAPDEQPSEAKRKTRARPSPIQPQSSTVEDSPLSPKSPDESAPKLNPVVSLEELHLRAKRQRQKKTSRKLQSDADHAMIRATELLKIRDTAPKLKNLSSQVHRLQDMVLAYQDKYDSIRSRGKSRK